MSRLDFPQFLGLRALSPLPNPIQLRQWARGEAQMRDLMATAMRHPMPTIVLGRRMVEVPLQVNFQRDTPDVRCADIRIVAVKARTEQVRADQATQVGQQTQWSPWIFHQGRSCPVPDAPLVKIRTRFGAEFVVVPGQVEWYHGVRGIRREDDIVAYQVKQPVMPEPQLTDWFPGTLAPHTPGVYELWNGMGERLFARFTREGHWMRAMPTVWQAQETSWVATHPNPANRTASIYRWCGFTSPQV